jgi:hypothetical protein
MRFHTILPTMSRNVVNDIGKSKSIVENLHIEKYDILENSIWYYQLLRINTYILAIYQSMLIIEALIAPAVASHCMQLLHMIFSRFQRNSKVYI